MSHKKVIELAKKFADKTVVHNINYAKMKHQAAFEEFKRKLRMVLNEMSGDHLTLRIKGFDRSLLKEFAKLYDLLLELIKGFDDENPRQSTQRIVEHMSNANITSFMGLLNLKINNFLDENQVDFRPSPGLTQVKVNSLSNLKQLIDDGHQLLNNSQ